MGAAAIVSVTGIGGAPAGAADSVPVGFAPLGELIAGGAFPGGTYFARQGRAKRWWAGLSPADRRKSGGRCFVAGSVTLPNGLNVEAFPRGGRNAESLAGHEAPEGILAGSEKNRQRFVDAHELLRREQACREKYPKLNDRQFAAVFAAEHGAWARERGLSCTPKTLRRYKRRLNPSSEDFDGNPDNRGRRKGDGAYLGCSPEAWLYYQQLYLGGVGAPSEAECHRITTAVATKNGWAWPSLRSIQLRTRHEIPEAVKTYFRKGKRAYAAQHEPKIHRNYEDLPAGSWYVLDGRKLDFWGRVPDVRRGWRRARFVIVGVLDVRSRMFVGWAIGTVEHSDLILRALKMALLEHGTPRDITIDNGEGFKAAFGVSGKRRELADDPATGQLCGALGVTLHRSIPYSAWSKLIESVWRQVKDFFDRWWWTFTGGSPAERHEDAEAEIKLRIDQLPRIEDVAAQFADWLRSYHATGKSGSGTFGLSPNILMEQYRVENRKADRSLLDVLTCRLEGPVTVTRDGVRWQGVLYGQTDKELWRLEGRRAWLRIDPVETGLVIVCDEAGNRICDATNERLLGATQEQRRESMQLKGKRRKVVREYAAARDGLLQPTVGQILEIKAAHARAMEDEVRKSLPTPPQPAEVKIVRPEIVGSAPRARRRARGAGGAAIDPFSRLAAKNGDTQARTRPDGGESVGAIYERIGAGWEEDRPADGGETAIDWERLGKEDGPTDGAASRGLAESA